MSYIKHSDDRTKYFKNDIILTQNYPYIDNLYIITHDRIIIGTLASFFLMEMHDVVVCTTQPWGDSITRNVVFELEEK